MDIINFDILKHPMNWLTVILMLIFAGATFHLIMRHWGNN